MESSEKKVRALGLCSGGLDSILSALILQKQGIDVEWISFETPFFPSINARKASGMTGIPLHTRNITPTYLEMLKNPRCGYGKHMNPCMDCHTLMFRQAGLFMVENGFNFLFSGEVLGQRPMSQTMSSLRYVEKHSGYDGLILRPLSAKKLPETEAEKTGLVDRDQLLDLSGRSRKPQMALAREFGITEYPSPAGGCLLTDKGFSDRLKDLFSHQGSYTERELNLLKLGRHFRLNDTTKIVIGRTKQENDGLMALYDPQSDVLIKVTRSPGPTVIMPHGGPKEMVFLAASICTGYSKAPREMPVQVNITHDGRTKPITVIGLLPKDVKNFLI
ncbi:MAG: tRNA 4-thiouridine(8) synthase ThiI [Desulfobacteraceae bacterium]|nr:tRNA 4-thiouridine(8) synthase ThiI [Desulfobacteraceae bacterium]